MEQAAEILKVNNQKQIKGGRIFLALRPAARADVHSAAEPAGNGIP